MARLLWSDRTRGERFAVVATAPFWVPILAVLWLFDGGEPSENGY